MKPPELIVTLTPISMSADYTVSLTDGRQTRTVQLPRELAFLVCDASHAFRRELTAHRKTLDAAPVV